MKLEDYKILIIEDEKGIARFLELELKHEGYGVDVAYDGREGLKRIESIDYDLVLLDIMLPGLNGIEICRMVRQFSSVPIIMLTAKDEISDKVLGLDIGADDYMTKPFAIEELLARIRVIKRKSASLLNRWGKDDRLVLDESVTAIKNETESMASLVEKLLFLARGDSGTQRLEKEEFWLNKVIDEVIKESRLIADNHKIVSTQNDSLSIYADRKMIKQMLRIFIDNSIKFTPEQGEIRIALVNQDSTAKITIEDTGMGIPEEDIPQIFNRFFRVDKARTREKGGSGLGLSIAKWIIDSHNGNISVESSVGKGTKIDITLPVR